MPIAPIGMKNWRRCQEINSKPINLAYHKSAYYKRHFREAGVAPFHLESFEDLKKFPTIDKKVLRSQQEICPDFGDLTCAPEEDFVFLSASSGSTSVLGS